MLTPTTCVLCGRQKVRGKSELCNCPPSLNCTSCIKDLAKKEYTKDYAVQYTCPLHGDYRHYEDLLMHYKSWCIVWVTVAVIPFALIIYASNINLTWVIFFLQGVLSPCALPLLLAIIWARCTSSAVIVGEYLVFTFQLFLSPLKKRGHIYLHLLVGKAPSAR